MTRRPHNWIQHLKTKTRGSKTRRCAAFKSSTAGVTSLRRKTVPASCGSTCRMISLHPEENRGIAIGATERARCRGLSLRLFLHAGEPPRERRRGRRLIQGPTLSRETEVACASYEVDRTELRSSGAGTGAGGLRKSELDDTRTNRSTTSDEHPLRRRSSRCFVAEHRGMGLEPLRKSPNQCRSLRFQSWDPQGTVKP